MPGFTSINIATKKRTEFIDITAQAAEFVKKNRITSGILIVYVPHTTAAVTINENADVNVSKDILSGLSTLAPFDGGYLHSEGNSDAHIKASLLGMSANVIIDDGELVLGVWQAIYFCEFDGPRNRQCFFKIIKA